jgi:hypothetical protein
VNGRLLGNWPKTPFEELCPDHDPQVSIPPATSIPHPATGPVRCSTVSTPTTSHLPVPLGSTFDTSVPSRRIRTGGWRGSDTASGSRTPPPLRKISRWKPRRINKFHAENPFQLQALNRFNRAALFRPSSCWPKSWNADHNTLSLRNQSLTFVTLPQRCTLWTGGGNRFGRHPNLALFRISCGAAASARFRGPGVPGRQSALLASFRPPASRALYAILSNRLEVEAQHNYPGWRLAPCGVVCRGGGPGACTVPGRPRRNPYPVEIEDLHTGVRTIGPRDPPCDASCQKGPPDASQNPEPRTQPIEKEELKRSCITTSHTRTRCVTKVGCWAALGKPVRGFHRWLKRHDHRRG